MNIFFLYFVRLKPTNNPLANHIYIYIVYYIRKKHFWPTDQKKNVDSHLVDNLINLWNVFFLCYYVIIRDLTLEIVHVVDTQ